MDRRRGSTMMIVAGGAVVVLLVLAVGAFLMKDKIKAMISPAAPASVSYTNSQPAAKQVVPTQQVTLPAEAISQTAKSPASNNSNTQLDTDINNMGTQMNVASQEQTGIDQGLNQTAPNVQ